MSHPRTRKAAPEIRNWPSALRATGLKRHSSAKRLDRMNRTTKKRQERKETFHDYS